MKNPPQSENALEDLLKVAHDLRDPKDGCPWDREQTHQSLSKNLIEEAYELVEAIENLREGADEDFIEELGDVLFQVVLHAELASEKKRFDFQSVARRIADKLIFRHPHVYGDAVANTTQAVLQNWEQLKLREKEKKATKTSRIDGIPAGLPALQTAHRLGEKAARSGFDWSAGEAGLQELREKINEERQELEAARAESLERTEEELGDYLFAIAQYARRLNIDPETALRKANRKFSSRYRSMEQTLAARLNDPTLPTAQEWEAAWQAAKATSRSAIRSSTSSKPTE